MGECSYFAGIGSIQNHTGLDGPSSGGHRSNQAGKNGGLNQPPETVSWSKTWSGEGKKSSSAHPAPNLQAFACRKAPWGCFCESSESTKAWKSKECSTKHLLFWDTPGPWQEMGWGSCPLTAAELEACWWSRCWENWKNWADNPSTRCLTWFAASALGRF